MNNILEARKLNKTYDIGKNNSQQVLRDVDLDISQGEFVLVMGPSGSGKSTLLYNISGMDRMTSGNVKFCGKEIAKMNEDELSKLRLTMMGFIFQQSSLLKNLSIFDNIILSAFRAKEESRQAINERATQLMEQTGILELRDNTITQASGGQLQRAAICRALINKPQIVFGDEPTGALNSKSAGEVMDILLEINQSGTTILLVTHDAKVAAKTERVLFMSDGVIAGEKQLGKCSKDKSDAKDRENELTSWLAQMGF
ncbi:putative ABC transport system ATP-binding protein [Kineothrix alysoides]|uniref:Putative ABC transport system ATP-binding protein n=1 Tax=Kineothrix alysoides TaxID=1469948 RepID=A0A4R1QU86_9FIRM|nr:ABC transporter ATP-binding protein [Kineothrix alysoides]TCL57529.1 putative ABC transport system ATP-binding protein [Kineothrix alysoides]